MRIIQSHSFEKKARRLPKQDKKILDKQVKRIAKDPSVGQEKRGELKGVFVHKFKIQAVSHLLSYRMSTPDTLELVMLGVHENYYRDLKTDLKTRR